MESHVRLIPQNGKGNINGNWTDADMLIKDGDNSYKVIETKLNDKIPLSPGQKAAQEHIGTDGGLFEIRTDIDRWNLHKGDPIFIKE